MLTFLFAGNYSTENDTIYNLFFFFLSSCGSSEGGSLVQVLTATAWITMKLGSDSYQPSGVKSNTSADPLSSHVLP